MQDGDYQILLKYAGQGPLRLSIQQQGSDSWLSVNSDNHIWSVRSIAGTDGFYLISKSLSLAANSKGSEIPEDPWRADALVPTDDQFVIRIDDVGSGWVAINNHDKTRVMDAKGSQPIKGAPVLKWRWNGGDNERWQFLPADQDV